MGVGDAAGVGTAAEAGSAAAGTASGGVAGCVGGGAAGAGAAGCCGGSDAIPGAIGGAVVPLPFVCKNTAIANTTATIAKTTQMSIGLLEFLDIVAEVTWDSRSVEAVPDGRASAG